MTDQLELDTGDDRLPPYVGITTVLGCTVWPGDDLLRWAWKLGRQNTLLTDARAHQARTQGLELHRVAEDLAAGRDVIVQQLSVGARGLAESLISWWRVRRPRVLASEISLQDPELRIRGRIDLVLECDDPGCSCTTGDWTDVTEEPATAYRARPAGRRGVIAADLKAGGDGRAGRHRLQVGGGYKLLWDAGGLERPPELAGRPFCRGELVRVYHDGSEALSTPVSARETGFRAALSLYRDLEADESLPERAI